MASEKIATKLHHRMNNDDFTTRENAVANFMSDIREQTKLQSTVYSK